MSGTKLVAFTAVTALTTLAAAQLSSEFQETYCQSALTCQHHGLDPVCAQQFCQGDPTYGVPCWQLVGFGAQAQACCTGSNDPQTCLIQAGIGTPCQVCGDSSGGSSDSSGSDSGSDSGSGSGSSSGSDSGAATSSTVVDSGSPSNSAAASNPSQTGGASRMGVPATLGWLGMVVGGMAVLA